ncbi:G kinase-anchoring protein 1-like [Uloborus diversus]|uniref:G kinase-anchoring protein 1-like n=1 Tax=Uloborus diversus TaxID=327109 RepID=UPI00240A8B60|nr:G kinase-anchoring protein 1-like [Uloborus diversus]
MAVACASRFAVLNIEDDDVPDSVTKKSGNIQNNGQSGKSKLTAKSTVTETKSKPKKKKKNTSEIAELQNLAFANSNTKSKSKSSNSKIVQAGQKQWEEWKSKDNEFVAEAYEQDLHEALLLSKIDFEEKKEIYDAIQKETEHSKQSAKKKKKNSQKKEKGTMSLDQFQNLLPSQINSGAFQRGNADLDDFELPVKVPEEETNFFNKIEEAAEKIITKEQKQDYYKSIDPVLESARLLQYQEEIRNKDEEILKLTESVKKLKEELKNVKSRNKKLYGILETGEMREKAEILVQIEQLLSVKDELTDQLNEYHTALEQERSKVHSLQTELKKFQNNRKQRTESK